MIVFITEHFEYSLFSRQLYCILKLLQSSNLLPIQLQKKYYNVVLSLAALGSTLNMEEQVTP